MSSEEDQDDDTRTTTRCALCGARVPANNWIIHQSRCDRPAPTPPAAPTSTGSNVGGFLNLRSTINRIRWSLWNIFGPLALLWICFLTVGSLWLQVPFNSWVELARLFIQDVLRQMTFNGNFLGKPRLSFPPDVLEIPHPEPVRVVRIDWNQPLDYAWEMDNVHTPTNIPFRDPQQKLKKFQIGSHGLTQEQDNEIRRQLDDFLAIATGTKGPMLSWKKEPIQPGRCRQTLFANDGRCTVHRWNAYYYDEDPATTTIVGRIQCWDDPCRQQDEGETTWGRCLDFFQEMYPYCIAEIPDHVLVTGAPYDTLNLIIDNVVFVPSDCSYGWSYFSVTESTSLEQVVQAMYDMSVQHIEGLIGTGSNLVPPFHLENEFPDIEQGQSVQGRANDDSAEL